MSDRAAGAPRVRIGAMLVAAGALSEPDLERALQEQKRSGDRLGNVLLRMGLVTEVQLTQMVSNQLSVPWVSLYHVEFSRELLNLVPADVAEQYCAVPIYVRQIRGQGSTLFVAMDDPSNEEALQRLAAASHLPVRAMVAPPTEIRNAIRVYYFGGREQPAAPPSPQTEKSPSAPAPAAAPAPGPAPKPPARAPERATSTPAATAPATGAAPKGKSRMITLTLLDGTSVSLPARSPRAAEAPAGETLTAKDLIAALDAATQGADVSDVLPERRWEALFSALLTLLMRKGLIADWEFVEEWSKRRR